MDHTSKGYKSVRGQVESFFEEEKSKFISHGKHVKSEQEALDFIDLIREEYKDATHNCYAYIINEQPVIKRYSDDGEPQGSAGLPMLSVLEKEQVTNLVVVVTRYFGGKLLGKAGLIRAYSRGVSDSLSGKVLWKRPYLVVELTHSYQVLGIIENYLNTKGYKLIDKAYTDEVKIKIYVREDGFERLKKDLINLTSANIKIEKKKSLMLFE
ncbi:MAG: YigZ family protein [Anaerococcus sp.]|nr:YigZ family protein [Anaerococcus sp.]